MADVASSGIGSYLHAYYVVSGSARDIVSSSPNYDDNNWHHVVAAWDSTQACLYVDGIKRASPGNDVLSLPNPVTGYIGRYVGSASNRWKGFVDDVRIYNRALSAADVSMLYLYGTVTLRNSTWKNFKTY